MKKRTDFILLTVLLLSLAVYAANIVYGMEYPFNVYLLLGFHAIPAFCLQLLLCRRTRRWVASLSLPLLALAALFFAYKSYISTGWDGLGWLILLGLCIAPAVGCVLAWAAYGLSRLYQKKNI